MTKRKKLSKGQLRRIKANRSKKLQAREDAPLVDDASLGPEQDAVVISRFGQHAEVETQDGHRVKAQIRRTVDSLVSGDQVLFRASKTDDGGVIEAVHPRRSMLTRPDYYDGVKVVAANIDHIFVVSSPLPAFSSQIIDRYLIAAEDTGIEVSIVLNKTDLMTDELRDELDQALEIYRQLGYRVILASAKSAEGVAELGECMADQVNILVGQSGVGKSSLVNALLPQAELLEGAVSDNSGLGQHTTTAAKLLKLDKGGALIDSPGVREFGLWHMDPERVTWCYREFRDLIGTCKFRDCKHNDDPGCAITEALANGDIDEMRYFNYLRIIESMAEQKDSRHIKQKPLD
ncbi:small ribosomal subunit biogenesis GTPase RsgA [Paraferrimonas sedimenticola]|uniref:Small ribosomal subunit biogenesis GTPase RsgA n=1 Tax=Paraferrimonas sedimenticola TaxID=375674 RepID=A0AA37RUT5_9GAMM|nr:small ribosomal subunit biogenesis GTPase RsgA [Paraferrimonas sedimenticola]GLP95749.1 putative ribosome biogenesis GTPase RsgA [Paraferrimonas sedimenticola]